MPKTKINIERGENLNIHHHQMEYSGDLENKNLTKKKDKWWKRINKVKVGVNLRRKLAEVNHKQRDAPDVII